MLGDHSTTVEKLCWTATTTLEELLLADLEESKTEAYLKRKGFAVVLARE